MKESDLLKMFAKSLNAEDALELVELERLKQQQKLNQLAEAFGVPIEQQVDRDVQPGFVVSEQEQIDQLVEHAATEAHATEVAPIVEQLTVKPELPVDNIVNKSVELISKAAPSSVQAVVDSIPDSLRKEIDIIKKSVADFHRFAARHSQMGGGGAGDIINLDMPVITVTANSYSVGRKDYYIGVDYNGNTTITLPSIAKAGRVLVVKDQSGYACRNPITILGNIDNDANGAILQQDNGAINMIYNNGWRII